MPSPEHAAPPKQVVQRKQRRREASNEQPVACRFVVAIIFTSASVICLCLFMAIVGGLNSLSDATSSLTEEGGVWLENTPFLSGAFRNIPTPNIERNLDWGSQLTEVIG